MPGIAHAKPLIKALADSGTPADALQPARDALVKAWKEEERHLTSREAYTALLAVHAAQPNVVSEGTIKKALSLCQTGELPPATARVRAEDEVPDPVETEKPKPPPPPKK